MFNFSSATSFTMLAIHILVFFTNIIITLFIDHVIFLFESTFNRLNKKMGLMYT